MLSVGKTELDEQDKTFLTVGGEMEFRDTGQQEPALLGLKGFGNSRSLTLFSSAVLSVQFYSKNE